MSTENVTENAATSFAGSLMPDVGAEATEAFRKSITLVKFSAHRFGEKKQDQTLSTRVSTSLGAESNAFEVTKYLFGKKGCPQFEALKSHMNSSYNTHKAMTRAWDDSYRAIVNADTMKYIAEMAKLKKQLDAKREEFRDVLPAAVERAKLTHGAQFDPAMFIGIERAPDAFKFEFEFVPIPEGADLHLPEGFKEKLSDYLRNRVETKYRNALEESWSKVLESLEAIKAKMEDEDARRYHQSMFDTLLDRVVTAAGLNISNNADYNRLCNAIRMDFKQYEAKQCGNGRSYCLHIAEKCKYYIACITIGMETEEVEDNVDLTDVFAEEEVPSLSGAVEEAVSELDEEPVFDMDVEIACGTAPEDATTVTGTAAVQPRQVEVIAEEEDIPLMGVEELEIEEVTYKPVKDATDEDVSLADLLGM